MYSQFQLLLKIPFPKIFNSSGLETWRNSMLPGRKRRWILRCEFQTPLIRWREKNVKSLFFTCLLIGHGSSRLLRIKAFFVVLLFYRHATAWGQLEIGLAIGVLLYMFCFFSVLERADWGDAESCVSCAWLDLQQGRPGPRPVSMRYASINPVHSLEQGAFPIQHYRDCVTRSSTSDFSPKDESPDS
jgi:hypothetical protein